MNGVADSPHVVPVAEGEKGKESDGGVLDGVNPAHEVKPFLLEPLGHLSGQDDPEAHGLEDVGGHLQLVHAEQVLAEDPPLFKTPDALRDLQPAVAGGEVRKRLGFDHRENLRLLLRKGAGVIIHVHRLDPDFPLSLVQAGDQVGFGSVEIDRSRVALAVNPGHADLADQTLGLFLENGESFSGAADVHQAMGVQAVGEPFPAGGASQKFSIGNQLVQKGSVILDRNDRLIRSQGNFRAGADQVFGDHHGIVRVHHRAFEPPSEKILRDGA